MPYVSHPNVETPPDDAILWRYMDFTKFIDLLDTSQLFFSRLDELGDRMEGFLTSETIETLKGGLLNNGNVDDETWAAFLPKHLEVIREQRQFFRINCWHESECESAAMWKLYLKSDEGIAIRTTVGRLKKAIASSENEIEIGRVKYEPAALLGNVYIDNFFKLIIHKRASFKYEQEVRLISYYFMDETGRVNVSLADLIESVYVAPGTKTWIVELVRRTLVRYGITAPLNSSSLDENPAY